MFYIPFYFPHKKIATNLLTQTSVRKTENVYPSAIKTK